MKNYLRILNRLQRIDDLKTPSKLILYVTNRCNLHCKHCFLKGSYLNKKEESLEFSEIEKIIGSLTNKLSAISLAGGEVILRKDLAEITLMIDKKNRPSRINIFSNGFFTEKIVEYVESVAGKLNAKLWFEVSIDGFSQTHDYIRNTPGLWNKAISTIEKIRELRDSKYSNIDLNVVTTITSLNVDEVVDVHKYIKEELKVNHIPCLLRDIDTCVFNLPSQIIQESWSLADKNVHLPPIPVLRKIIDQIYPDNSMNSLQETMERIATYYALDILEHKKTKLKCTAGITDGVIYSNGDVAICENAKPFANIKEFNFNFYDLWHSDVANEKRGQMEKCFCTHQYNLINSMRYDENTLKFIDGLDFRIS